MTFEQVERFAFYERAKKAFAIVHTGYSVITIHCLYSTDMHLNVVHLCLKYCNVLFLSTPYN